jgi:FixJ family two-component response regulator
MKAVFVSGYTDDAMIHHGMLPPGVGFLQKPFMGAALVRKVREILDSEDGKA